MKNKIFICLLAVFMCFMITGCGSDNSSGTGGSKKFNGIYEFNPPTNNYYVEEKDINEDDTIITAKIDKAFTRLEKDTDGTEYMYHVNEDTQKIYTKYEGEWYLDSYSYYEDYEKDKSAEIFYAMEEYFMKYFKAFDYEIEKLSEYYVGNEKIAGVNCWVFDSKGLNAVQMKFWVNPENGTTLKYINKESGNGIEVVKMDLKYKKWTNDLVPKSYEGIEGL